MSNVCESLLVLQRLSQLLSLFPWAVGSMCWNCATMLAMSYVYVVKYCRPPIVPDKGSFKKMCSWCVYFKSRFLLLSWALQVS